METGTHPVPFGTGFYIVWGAVRIAIGWSFLWAFLDKLFGLGFATASERAWLAGGSPTTGFLQNATKGPFADFYQNLAGSVVVDWLFMMGLLFVGLALMLGVFVRLAGIFGAVMMVLMYTAAFLPPENNPLVDEHIIYALIFVALSLSGPACCWLSTHSWWERTALVRKHPWLR